MKVRRELGPGRPGRRYTVEGLTAGQLAYVIALVGASRSGLNRDGEALGAPLVPEDRDLWQPLQLAMIAYGLNDLVNEVEESQKAWRRKHKAEDVEDVAV